MKPDLIEQFFEQTPQGVTVRISMPGRDLYIRRPARKAASFGDGCYYIEADTKEDRDAPYSESEILIDCSSITHLSRIADR